MNRLNLNKLTWRWRPGGFTMAEMLVTLSLASIGMVGAFGIQVTANTVQRQARDINTARVIGESFLSALRAETTEFTETETVQTLDTTEAPLIWYGISSNPPGTWLAVPNRPFTSASTSPRFNALGLPDDPSDSRVSGMDTALLTYNMRYCIHYNLQPVAGQVAPGALLRAQVRVFWPIRMDSFAPTPAGVPDCGYSDPEDMATNIIRQGQFRYLQLTTVLFRHTEF